MNKALETERLSEERLDEILAGLEGVTPGPWKACPGDDYYISAKAYPITYPHRFKGDNLGGMLAEVGNRPSDYGKANAAHIARCDPDTIRALVTELLSLRRSPNTGGVKVKPLEWHGPDVNGDIYARSILCVYTIRANMGSLGHWLTEVGGYYPTVQAAKAAAQADFERRILSCLDLSQAERGGEVTVTQPNLSAPVRAQRMPRKDNGYWTEAPSAATFDILERYAIEHPELRYGFSRSTGGVDVDLVVATFANDLRAARKGETFSLPTQPSAAIDEDAVERAARIISPNCLWSAGYVNEHIERRRENARNKARAALTAASQKEA